MLGSLTCEPYSRDGYCMIYSFNYQNYKTLFRIRYRICELLYLRCMGPGITPACGPVLRLFLTRMNMMTAITMRTAAPATVPQTMAVTFEDMTAKYH